MIREFDDQALDLASEFLARGDLVAFAGEHGYVLACEPFIPEAVASLHRLRGAAPGIALPLFVGYRSTLDGLAHGIDPAVTQLLIGAWPGLLTLVTASSVPWDLGAGAGGWLSVRQPAEPVALRLSQSHGPIAATSAAPAGKKSLSAREVDEFFGDAVALIVDSGPRLDGPASTVLRCHGARVVIEREGALSVEELKRLGPALQFVEADALG